jgi:hypothetical protein
MNSWDAHVNGGRTMRGAYEGPERLPVVAALIDCDKVASRAADSWVHTDGQPYSPQESEMIDSASADERQLAEGLRGGSARAADPDGPMIAGLLRLADGTDLAPLLRAGLRQMFLIPDDSWHAAAREDRTAEFAGLYRRLALPGLGEDARQRADTLLAGIR